MKRMMLIVAVSLGLAACSEAPEEATETAAPAPTPQPSAQALVEQFVTASPGDVIEIPAGVYELERSLTLNVDGVTVRGAGMEETVLSFRNQVAGAEGLLVNASDFTIEDIAIEDAKGDALKVNEGRNVIIRRVRTEWTGGPNVNNGAYGIYPVQIENVLVEDSVAIAASDAGIYVGQSKNIIVRRNRAEYNVAGIEIENSIGADVYENVAMNNTGGVLVFNMPDLPQEGHSTRVYRNAISANNTANFAPAGTAVAGVPAGTGILINSNDRIEIFDNTISDNATANILISSFHASTLQDRDTVEGFDAYPESIYIYRNEFEGGGTKADRDELEQLRVALFGEDGALPDVLWDGYVDEGKFEGGSLPAELRICLGEGDVSMINVDAPNGYAQPRVVTADHRCDLPKLEPITLAIGGD